MKPVTAPPPNWLLGEVEDVKLGEETMGWYRAHFFCRRQKPTAELAFVDGQETQDLITAGLASLNAEPGTRFWLGAKRGRTSGKYVWKEEESLAWGYENFESAPPAFKKGDPGCIVASADSGKWTQEACRAYARPLCVRWHRPEGSFVADDGHKGTPAANDAAAAVAEAAEDELGGTAEVIPAERLANDPGVEALVAADDRVHGRTPFRLSTNKATDGTSAMSGDEAINAKAATEAAEVANTEREIIAKAEANAAKAKANGTDVPKIVDADNDGLVNENVGVTEQ